jgi:hypothetical protein
LAIGKPPDASAIEPPAGKGLQNQYGEMLFRQLK